MSRIIFDNKFRLLGNLLSAEEVFMVYDENVAEYADEIAGLADFKGIMSLETYESTKTMETVLDIERFLLALGADRQALLLAVGGGVCCDLAGFAASVYKRGIRCAYVPTTLLSQVDAAIGGKTAVNLDCFKNMVGSFHEPLFTYINTLTLKTLPERELRSGYAEMLKTFMIKDKSGYETALNAIVSGAELDEFIKKAAEIKAEIVEKDPFEKCERKKLNLGHTFAHAIEWYEQVNNVSNPLSHGEAVAIGIVMAAEMESPELAAKIAEDFKACGLPTESAYSKEDLLDAMRKDKKNKGEDISFVKIKAIGEVEI